MRADNLLVVTAVGIDPFRLLAALCHQGEDDDEEATNNVNDLAGDNESGSAQIGTALAVEQIHFTICPAAAQDEPHDDEYGEPDVEIDSEIVHQELVGSGACSFTGLDLVGEACVDVQRKEEVDGADAEDDPIPNLGFWVVACLTRVLAKVDRRDDDGDGLHDERVDGENG